MEKEITIIEKKVNIALQLSEALIIKDENSLSEGIDLRSKIKKTGKIIKEQKEKITKPLNEALKNARNLFRTAESLYSEAYKNVGDKIDVYVLEEERKKREAEEKLAKRVEKGTMKAETAVKKIEAIHEVSKEGKVGKIQMRTNRKMKITDESKLPRKYLVPNEVLIRKDALAGIEIAGVKVIEVRNSVNY